MSQVSRHQLALVVVLAIVAAGLVFLSWPTQGGSPGNDRAAAPPVATSAVGQAGPARPDDEPTRTPSSVATATAGPARTLSTGRFPGAANTGPRAGGTTAPWSGGTSGLSAESDKSYDRVVVPRSTTGSWVFSGSNVTFRDCTFAGPVVFTGDHVRVEHCDINGGLTLSGSTHVVLIGNAIHDWVDGIRVTSASGKVTDVSITDNWVHNPAPACTDHADGIRLLGVDNLVVTNNTVDLGPWIACGPLNNAIQADSTSGPDLNMSITNNLLNGGVHTVRFGACTKTTFENNHFGPDAKVSQVDAPAYPACFISWKGNVVEDTSKPVNPTS